MNGLKPIRHKGFTLIEIMVVIVIMAILVAITSIVYRGMQERAKTVAILAAVEQWAGVIGAQSVSGATIAAHTCLGDADDFPARDGFGQGVCVTSNGASAMTFNAASYGGWSSAARPQGDMPITQVTADATTVRARGIWIQSLDANGVNIAWVPQVSAECGKGTPYVESTNPLAGGMCMLHVPTGD